ncbi:MAG: 5-dehydro-2-deoxygluconokinase [Alphaproteobacteria bacterium]
MLEKLKQNNFLVIGRAGMDFYPDPPGTRTEDATSFVSHLGGSSANIAVAICRHGGAAELVTCVSDDAIGRFAINQLKLYGVGHSHVRFESGPTGNEARNSLAIVESRTDDHQSVIYRNGAADFLMNVDDIEAVDFSPADKPYGAMVTTGTLFAAEPSRTTTFRAMERAKEAGIPIVFDIDYRPYSWPSAEVAQEVYEKAGRLSDIVIGNDDEFGFMAGGKDKGLAFAKALANSTNGVCVYKMGEKGSVTFEGGREFARGIYPVTALKPTGAGDAFMGGFLSSLANGYDLEDAVERGSASAAIVVANVGCAPAMPTTEQLHEFMKNHQMKD